MKPLPDSLHCQITRDTYNGTASAYDAKFSAYKPYLEAFYDFLSVIPPASRILDIGCGPGILAELATNHGHVVTGIDASEAMIQMARTRCPLATFLTMSANEIHQLETEFNVAVVSFLIVHLKDIETDALIADVSGLLDEHGSYLYLSFMTGKTAGYETTSFSPDRTIYFNYYQAESILAKVHRAGFNLLSQKRQLYPEQDGSQTEDILMILHRK